MILSGSMAVWIPVARNRTACGGMERCSLEAEKDKDQEDIGFDSVKEGNSLPVPVWQNLK